MEIEKTYCPKKFENKINELWKELKIFEANNETEKPTFSVLLPPPNITGRLHIGHAMNVTLQDILVRYKKMSGYETMWCPGTDHAAIATEAKVVSDLAKRGLKKEDLTREQFEKEMQNWYKQYGGFIIDQLKGLGLGCDWSREFFTRDDKRNEAVTKAFIDLWEKGLIYRGERLTNWCPNCKTAVSDIEVVYEERKSKLYHLRYYIENSNEYLIVATTRPETLFGDLAVAVNPNDERLSKYIGKNVVLPLCNRVIPIIGDDYVDMEFGTGALKITPSHDINDYMVGKKHNLGLFNIMEKDGTLNENCGKFKGLSGMNARNAVVDALIQENLLEKQEDYDNKVGTCERCHTTIESLVSEQWFMSMKDMANKVLEELKNGNVHLYPTKFNKDLQSWLENIQDWCISRQLWSGHKIPVFYCNNCGNAFASQSLCHCPKCNSNDVKQDEDVLDTWFSSGLLPVSSLDIYKQNADFAKFYPYSVLVTGYDIIFFWIARMLFFGKEFTNIIPFKDIIINGLVRDEFGRKLSKNLGNGVDPQDVVDEFGADALRMALVYNVALGGDSKFSNDKIDFARRFSNKIWNASRFVQMNTQNIEILPLNQCSLTIADKWILYELNSTIKKVRHLLDNFDLGIALSEIYDFAWAKFCDYYIEFSKPNMQSDKQKQTSASVLKYVLNEILRLLHPFIPFITEEIYLSLNQNEKSILLSQFPSENKDFEKMEVVANEMLSIMDMTRQIRNIRTQFKVDAKKIVDLQLFERLPSENIKQNIIYLETLTDTNISLIDMEIAQDDIIILTTPYYYGYIVRSSVVDIESERIRLNNEIEKNKKEHDKLMGILNNQEFISHAPSAVVDKYKANLKQLEERLLQLNTSLQKIEK